jgi:FkbH-like protein
MSSYPIKADNLIKLLRWRATHQPTQEAYTFLQDNHTEKQTITYEELDRRSRQVGAWLQSKVDCGERALILYPPSLDYIVAFFGCLYAGVVAVPAYPPRSRRSSPRLRCLFKNAGAKIALTTTQLLTEISSPTLGSEKIADARWLDMDKVENELEGEWKMPVITGDTLALLQYTSGSTGDPRGVMLSHGNLMNNQARIFEAFELTDDAKIVSWLPLYHDMGLIGGILQPLYGGFHCVLLSPASFLQNPYRWLQAITNNRASVSGGPNFAYDLCVSRISDDQRESLDLSCWRVAFNGAEPVRRQTLENFSNKFSVCGFRRHAFYPCYGLAEATLLVSGGKSPVEEPRVMALRKASLERRLLVDAPTGDADAYSLISCGRVCEDQKVLIVNPNSSEPCAPNEIGEIWIDSPSVAKGYWNRPAETAQTFQAHIAGSGGGAFLRTGDLGFLREGELYVTARCKDLIIIHGLNYYPQDIEWTVEKSNKALRSGGGAAFSVDVNGEERLVIIQEVEYQQSLHVAEIIDDIRKSVGEEYELDAYAIVLVRPRSVPRTSSGKIRRSACRDQFIQRSLKAVVEWQEGKTSSDPRFDGSKESYQTPSDRNRNKPFPRTDIEMIVAGIWSHVLSVEAGVHDNFFALGGNSLSAAQIVSRLKETYGIELPHDFIFKVPTIAELGRHISLLTAEKQTAKILPINPAHRGGPLPLSFAQERMWFLEQLFPGNPFYNITVEARLKGRLNVQALEKSLRWILVRHAVLRASFPPQQGLPVQFIASEPAIDLPITDLSGLAQAERDTEAKRAVSAEAARPFDFVSGPMLRANLLRLAPDEHLLLLSTHHIVCDGWGLGILIGELNNLYTSLAGGKQPYLPHLTIQYPDFALWQKEILAKSKTFENQAIYWRKKFARPLSSTSLPTDFGRPQARNNEGLRITGEFDLEFTQRLKEFSVKSQATLFIVLLWALKILLYRWTRQPDIVVGTVVANRGRRELEQLIGCFMNFLVLRSELSDDLSAYEALERIKHTTFEAFANQDYPFEKLVNEINPNRDLSGNPIYSVGLWLHNYSVPRVLEGMLESETRLVDTHTADLDLRVIATETSSGSIAIDFEYSSQLFSSETMGALFRSYQKLLEALLQNPEQSISALQLDEKLKCHTTPYLNLVVAANFTAEPVESFISYWMELLGQSVKIQFAPYNQIFQQLLHPSSLMRTNMRGHNIILLSLEHWLKEQPQQTTDEDLLEIKENVEELLSALRTASSSSESIYLLGCCPCSDGFQSSETFSSFVGDMHQLLATEAKNMRGVYVVELSEGVELYEVNKTHDQFTDELGNVPYTQEFFAATGTLLTRKIFALLNPPYKVALLDCDQTLWRGVCGEDGYQGVEITSPYIMLQEFMVRQKDVGLLLALCSKNNEGDVLEVFHRRSEMVLKLSDLAAWRINWNSKSHNLMALAEELQLSPDSFIFIDDDPVVCAEIREQYPGALTLQLPANGENIPKFLEHVWAFDRIEVTEEDKQRTSMYSQNLQRESLKRASMTLADFLARLELKVEITPMMPEQLTRVIQLARRVNQFKILSTKHLVQEQFHWVATGAGECWTVEVSDKFGDYGLVGVIIFDVQGRILQIDSFLLSCRALGREVEFNMLGKVSQIADERGCEEIVIPYIPTEKNTPALKFLTEVFKEPPQRFQDEYCFRSSTEIIKQILSQRWTEHISISNDPAVRHAGLKKADSQEFGSQDKSELINRIANEFQRADSILQAISSGKRSRPQLRSAYVAPRTPIEEILSKLWAKTLGVERIGIYDNFFEFGGHSLLATQLLSRVRDEFRVELTLNVIFETPTVAGLTGVIARTLAETLSDQSITQMLEELDQLTEQEARILLGEGREDNLTKR